MNLCKCSHEETKHDSDGACLLCDCLCYQDEHKADEEYLPDLLWITTTEENLPYLESIGVQVGEYTGTQYRNCRVPTFAIGDMFENWGELMFGYEEDDSTGPEHYVQTVLKYGGKKEIPLLISMGMMRKPAAVKVAVTA